MSPHMNIYVSVLGWIATFVGFSRMYPQAVTIARSRSVTGVSSWSVAITVLSMVWWLIYCVAIADLPSSVSSLGSAIAPIACLVLLHRRGAVHTGHLLLIAGGSLLGGLALMRGTDIVGFLAAGSTMAYAIPQFHHLLRTRDVAGLSEASWALTAFNTALWTLYGWHIQSIPLMLPALVTIPVAIVVALSMERYGRIDGNDGVLIGPKRRSFNAPVRPASAVRQHADQTV